MSEPVWTWNVPREAAALTCGNLRAAAIVHEKGGFISLQEWDGQKASVPFQDDQFDAWDLSALQALAYMAPNFRSESLQLADAYVRGNDLVASYSESGGQRIAPEIYWRATHLEEFATAKIELIVSIRTGLLDSEPASRVHSSINAEGQLLHAASLDPTQFEVIKPATGEHNYPLPPTKVIDAAQSSEHLFLFRLPQFALSYAAMVHPSDFVSAEAHVDTTPPHSFTATIFPEHLEKGVIRRGRVCGWFMPLKNDLHTAVTLARQFVDEPLPLTA
jgi:hypothetical protein